ncbi:NAD-dependent epimerase/dehydratase family protein [Pseudoalteromonas piscicida]|uniref:NAD-dependent epimerase/dehydratase family protein n=1 Tax=Pseudoalteromonas piscicida TaxID=43662 RepID=UPI00309BEE91
MKVLITGASGFIGSCLHNSLVKKQFEVTALMRDESLSATKNFQFLTYKEFYALGGSNEFDVVLHLAGAAHREFSDEEAKSNNEILTQSIVNKSKDLGVKRFIFLSCAGLYKERDEKVDLNTLPDNLDKNTNYFKLQAENIVKSKFSDGKGEFVILRAPLVYGEGVKANFSALMKVVGTCFPLPFRGLNNKRSLVSVYNLIDLVELCIQHPKAANQVFLVSDDNDLSTAEMVSLMARVQNKPNLSLPLPLWCFKLIGRFLDKQDVIDRLTGTLQLDITHTKNTLDWSPPYSVEHGFKLAVRT